MDNIIKYLDTSTLIKIYHLTNNLYYKEYAERLLGYQIYPIQKMGMIILEDISITISDNIIVKDIYNNSISLCLYETTLYIMKIYIQDLKTYIKMYNVFRTIFEEFHIKSYNIKKHESIICYYKNLEIHKKFSIYSNNKLYKIL